MSGDPKEKPPSGLKVTAVLVGLLSVCCLTCAGASIVYAYYLEMHSLR